MCMTTHIYHLEVKKSIDLLPSLTLLIEGQRMRSTILQISLNYKMCAYNPILSFTSKNKGKVGFQNNRSNNNRRRLFDK